MKKIIKFFIVLVVTAILSVSLLYYLAFGKINYNQLNFVQKYIAKSAYNKFELYMNSIPKDSQAVINYNVLLNKLNIYEKGFIKKIFAINPKDLGFKGPFCSIEMPEHPVKVNEIKLKNSKNSSTVLGVQYCPDHSYKDFLRMNEKMKKDIGREVYINSGYRSSGKQAYLFIMYLVTSSGYSLNENARWIAFPGYSEHGDPINTALDLVNKDGIDGFSEGQSSVNFESLPEYKWLLSNARKFNFHLSYPKNNKLGVAFEPWHWRWYSKKSL